MWLSNVSPENRVKSGTLDLLWQLLRNNDVIVRCAHHMVTYGPLILEDFLQFACIVYLTNRPQVSMGYLSNRPQFSMGNRLINHAGCWQNTRRICKSRAAGEWFTKSSSVLPTSQVVYQPKTHRNLWSIAIIYYIITQVILAFWLVLAYDLLEDRRTIDVIVDVKFFPLCQLKWRKVLRI